MIRIDYFFLGLVLNYFAQYEVFFYIVGISFHFICLRVYFENSDTKLWLYFLLTGNLKIIRVIF